MCEDTGLSENKDGALMLHKDTFSIQIVLNCMLEWFFADTAFVYGIADGTIWRDFFWERKDFRLKVVNFRIVDKAVTPIATDFGNKLAIIKKLVFIVPLSFVHFYSCFIPICFC